MTVSELTSSISSNLRQIADLNMQVRAINHGFHANPPQGFDHRLVLIETATARIISLMFWVNHWTDALAEVGV